MNGLQKKSILELGLTMSGFSVLIALLFGFGFLGFDFSSGDAPETGGEPPVS
jgi:hypothetical protein